MAKHSVYSKAVVEMC